MDEEKTLPGPRHFSLHLELYRITQLEKNPYFPYDIRFMERNISTFRYIELASQGILVSRPKFSVILPTVYLLNWGIFS